MKRKSKLTTITAVFVILLLMISDILLLSFVKDAIIHDAQTNEGYEATNLIGKFQEYCARVGNVDRDAVQYYLKDLNNDYIVCLNIGEQELEEYYNKTIYDGKKIRTTEIQSESKETQNYIHAFVLDRARHIYAYASPDIQGMTLYYLADLQDVYHKVNLLNLATILSALLILAVSFILIYHIQKHTRQLEVEAEKRLLFMGNLTHELKTPFTAIQGYAETLLKAKLSEEDTVTALTFINSESKRLNRLSKKMMNILELSNEGTLQIKEVSIYDIFTSVKQACEALAVSRGITVTISPTELILPTDRDLMTDVLVNLCDNAIKASEPNTEVRLYEQDARIIVEDQGCGIPEDEIEKITQPFYRVDKSRSRQNGGSGLGLYLIATILKKMNMKYEIDSVPGQGTKMIIYNSFNL